MDNYLNNINKYYMKFKTILDDEYKKSGNIFTKLVSCDDKIITQNNKMLNIKESIDLYCNNKKIINAEYEHLGVYDTTTHIFSWGWNLFLIDKTKIENILKIKNFSKTLKKYILKKQYADVEYMERLLYYITHNMFFIEQDNLKDIFMLSTFITKNIYVYGTRVDKNIIEFVLVKNILGT